MENELTKTDSTEQTSPIFIDSVDFEQSKDNPDFSKIYALPSIKTRYISTQIDVILILLATFGIAAILDKFDIVPNSLRGILFLFIVILYEPILISFGCTFGQLMTNIRVRKFKDPESKIYLHIALIRLLIKWLLGVISFIMISFNINRRAIHDYASGSIMIANKIERK